MYLCCMIDFQIALQTVLTTHNVPARNTYCKRRLRPYSERMWPLLRYAALFPFRPWTDTPAVRQIRKGMKVLEVLAAGDIPKYAVTPGTCGKIMTGAMVPEGADAVLIVEHATEREGLIFGPPPVTANIIRREKT